mmetsp:Transcript_2529/g.2169  ORF Transcript_2529/g.2169 Transcript_2529/m.2169 type:complete len:115 (+) Transcript_2529:1846-2190(+)
MIRNLNQLIFVITTILLFLILVFYIKVEDTHLRYNLLNVIMVAMIPVQYLLILLLFIKKRKEETKIEKTEQFFRQKKWALIDEESEEMMKNEVKNKINETLRDEITAEEEMIKF